MNAFSRQGKALLPEVRNQIIEKWLSSDDTASISRQSNLPCKYGGELLMTVFYGRFDCCDIFAVPSLLNHLSIFDF